ncbi:MAG: UDP-N-acetylmuramate--L-alanine ligase [Thermoleophilia bacterium]
MSAPRRLHLVGIGGAGMSGLARLAVAAGDRVSGTDREESHMLDSLRALGVDARAGHDGRLPDALDALVVSTAIAPDNPDLVAARDRGVPVIHRAQLLAQLMEGHRGLTVAGAHGKSTTSAMLRLALGGASACIGATIDGGDGTGSAWGTGPWFVAEADESDRSLLHLRPEATILLNVDHDHHSEYASLAEVEEVFAKALAALPADGMVVAGPDPRAWALACASGRPHRLIGHDEGAWGAVTDRHADGTTVLRLQEGRTVTFRLAVPGEHNATNAACAIAMADWCGVDAQVAADRLAAFTGVGRRWEHRGTVAGITVIDDYAHHPAEVAATLAAARERHHGAVIAVFQPHLYSRTRALAREFGEALSAADIAIVTDVYPAREAPVPGVTGQLIVDAVDRRTPTEYAPTLKDALRTVMGHVGRGDLVLTLGAGDITRLGQELVVALQNTYSNGDPADGARRPD